MDFNFIGTIWSLLPPVVAIALALKTKEVYSSLFIGIVLGAVLFCLSMGTGFDGFLSHLLNDTVGEGDDAKSYGLIHCLSDPWNVGILVFLVVLGSIVSLMNKEAEPPAIVFIVAACLAFATGTSWGTFGILIPICIAVFPVAAPLRIISISACMAGAVCGDHISPISDTTIMASAGAECKHVHHVSSQLPYALTVAGVSFLTFVVAGLTQGMGLMASAAISWISGIILLIVALTILKRIKCKKE